MLSITKQQLSELPEVKYPGKVILIDSAAKSRSALAYLNRITQVGFDTETRPSFQKFRHYNVSLAQISAEEECFLFRLKQIGSLDNFMRFLENPDIQKIGLSLKDDFHSLSKLASFNPQGFVELQSFVKDYQIADNSLQKNIWRNFQAQDIQKPASYQLGSTGTYREPATLCRHRRMGLPANLQPPACRPVQP